LFGGFAGFFLALLGCFLLLAGFGFGFGPASGWPQGRAPHTEYRQIGARPWGQPDALGAPTVSAPQCIYAGMPMQLSEAGGRVPGADLAVPRMRRPVPGPLPL